MQIVRPDEDQVDPLDREDIVYVVDCLPGLDLDADKDFPVCLAM